MPTSQLMGTSLLWAGCVICLVAAFCIRMSRDHHGIRYNKEKQKWIFWMELSSAILLAADALACEFDGQSGTAAFFIVRISNFAIFVQSDVVLFFFHQHVTCHLFREKEERKNIKRIYAVCWICVIGIVLVCISQFTGLYYTFDEFNVYHRNPVYIIAILIPAIGMMIDVSLLVQYKNKIATSLWVTMISYLVLPVIAAVFQIFHYGLSYIDLSIGFSMVLMYITAVREQNEELETLSKSQAQTVERLEIETVLNKCIAQLSSGKKMNDSINQLLVVINDYFEADRTYIFEADYERNIVCNTYEYVKDQVTEEKDNLQEVPIRLIAEWMEAFKKSQVYYVSDLEQKKGTSFYELIHDQAISSLIEVPLQSADEVIGFLGVDNPRKHYDDPTLLSSIRFFVTNSLEKKKEQDYLEYLSYRDMLTKLYNRNKYIEILDANKNKQVEKVGAAYIDLNGLKKVNDQQGHEAGDALIKKAGTIIASFFPENSYRIGGDEFVILMMPVEERPFFEKVSQLSDALKKNEVSISMGIIWRDKTNDIEEMLQQADHSMYEQKERYHRQFGYYRR